jgi:hypothetical protein
MCFCITSVFETDVSVKYSKILTYVCTVCKQALMMQ